VSPAQLHGAGSVPLRVAGRPYGERLAALGVDAEVVEYPTMIHGFFSMTGYTPVAVEAAERAAAALKAALTA
jgi:acetyl esterase